jgi:hypothetical protein
LTQNKPTETERQQTNRQQEERWIGVSPEGRERRERSKEGGKEGRKGGRVDP